MVWAVSTPKLEKGEEEDDGDFSAWDEMGGETDGVLSN